MAISGSVSMEDVFISFVCLEGEVHYMVTEYDPKTGTNRIEHKYVPQDKFFKALSIAVHNEGMPNAEADYPDAESIMGEIRWIP